MYDWDFRWVWTYRYGLLEALWITVELNAIVIAFGSVFGLFLALARSSRFKTVRALAIIYIDLLRTLPVLVLLIWFFFCVPILLGGIRLSPMSAAAIVLSMNLAAFVAEIVRAGIEAVPRFHIEAADACKLSRPKAMRYVILPIALRQMIPPLVGQYINTIKLSVLASVIAVPELLNKTTDLTSQVYRPLEFYTTLAIIFLLLLLPGTIWSRKLESSAFVKRLESSSN